MQAVYNIAEICARHGITDVVLSPGSRSAPLTLAFARHPDLTVRVVPDERAAAFIGLGIAQAQRRAVALVCTSGTAGLNYAPAVAEAFFQQIPLVIFTADRPPEWIDQLDGQTIRQHNLYGAHAKGAFEFPVDTTHPDAKWHSARIVNEAINLAQAAPAGPVQVNVPLREPFYPKAGEVIGYEQDVQIMKEAHAEQHVSGLELYELRNQFAKANKALIVAGQGVSNQSLRAAVRTFPLNFGVPLVADIIANFPENFDYSIHRQDIFLTGLSTVEKQNLYPDLLITFGNSLISKSLKIFLREAKPTQHWHVQAEGPVADTFRTVTRIVRTTPSLFFQHLLYREPDVEGDENQDLHHSALNNLFWLQAERKADKFISAFFTNDNPNFNEFSVFRRFLNSLPSPQPLSLHLANSMAVRYANILGIPQGKNIEVFANRGTSGIDGCNSTAVGAALAQPQRPVVLLTGDVAFFYDRNAFWHNYPLPNLRVVLFNNHGGGIFRMIDGPRQQPELDEFFETRQALTAENTARDFNLRYFPVSSFAELEVALSVFFAAETGAAILEVFTDSKTNAEFFEEYRAAVKAAFA